MTIIHWTDELVKTRLLAAVATLGLARMPTASELRSLGQGNALATKVARTGGFDQWAENIGLPVAQHCSRRGWRWEEWFVNECTNRGIDAVRPGGVKSADVIANGIEVEVKSAEWGEYGHDKYIKGWFFHIHNVKIPPLLAAVCLRDDTPVAVHMIPGRDVPRSTLTICRSGKWQQYRDRWDLLEPSPL